MPAATPKLAAKQLAQAQKRTTAAFALAEHYGEVEQEELQESFANDLKGLIPRVLLVDDDEPFLRRLAKAMEKRGFEVETAASVAAGRAIATARPPAYAVVDLRLEDGNGLDVVEVLRDKRPDSRVVVLTGYGAIATAVAAPGIEVSSGR